MTLDHSVAVFERKIPVDSSSINFGLMRLKLWEFMLLLDLESRTGYQVLV